jgi:hypothetical protein
LQELQAKFVLVKVDHDAEPALVRQYGVQPLPDVRLLAADGKELDKLVGFTGASRLAARLQGALDRAAGHVPEPEPTPADSPSAKSKPEVKAIEATPDAVGLAVLHGVSFLRGEWRKGWTAPPRFAPDELVLFAFASSGLRRSDADTAGLLARLLEAPPTGTYRAALRACALQRLDATDLRPRIEECARFLEATQLANGQWTYGPPAGDAAASGSGTPSLGDHSNSAYALLGLAACRKAGVAVSRDVVAKAMKWWLRAQNEDGGFGYRTDRESASYASMTASGLHGLLLANSFGSFLAPSRDDATELTLRVAHAAGWLRDHFSVRENSGSAYQEGRRLYNLYAIERVGDTPPAAHFLPDDWYRQGAEHLLATQHDDGSWDDGAEAPIPDTCFALLFLTRASAALR